MGLFFCFGKHKSARLTTMVTIAILAGARKPSLPPRPSTFEALPDSWCDVETVR